MKPKTITQLIRDHKNGDFKAPWILDIEVYIFKSPTNLNHGDKSYIKFVLCQDKTQTKNIVYLHNLLLKEPDHPFNGLEFRIILK